MTQNDSLREAIRDLLYQGKLPKAFRRNDILSALRDRGFALTYLKTALANYCEGTGNYVKCGTQPWFRRVSKGLYEMI